MSQEPGEVLTRPVMSEAQYNDAKAAWDARPRGHCYDAEKCNAETFCDCICQRCMRNKRGEYETR